MSMPARFAKKLLHPATLIAVLALFIATSSAAYAIVITGKQIKNGTVTGVDIKNGSLTGVDVRAGSLTAANLAPTAKGVRAVATVWSDGTNCFITAATSRGFTACARGGLGDYTLTVSPAVSLLNTYPMCSHGSNGGFNTIYQTTCDVGYPGTARQVRIRIARVPEDATTGPEPFDPSSTVPMVVAIP